MEQEQTDNAAEDKANPYQKPASLGGWSGAGRTLWAIGTLGTVAGTAIGLAAPFFPVLVNASTLSTALGVVGPSVAAFASIGMAMGFAGGLMLGRISGSNSAVAVEQEKRMKQWIKSQLKQIDPNFKEAPSPEVSVSSIRKNQSVRDIYETYINPRIGMTMAAVGAVAGLILSAGYLVTGGHVGVVGPMLESVTGVADIGDAPKALTAYTMGVTTSFGALFMFNFPKITSNMTEFSGKLIGGKIIGRTWEPQRQQETEIASGQQVQKRRSSTKDHIAEEPSISFVDKVGEPMLNYQDMILDKDPSNNIYTR